MFSCHGRCQHRHAWTIVYILNPKREHQRASLNIALFWVQVDGKFKVCWQTSCYCYSLAMSGEESAQDSFLDDWPTGTNSSGDEVSCDSLESLDAHDLLTYSSYSDYLEGCLESLGPYGMEDAPLPEIDMQAQLSLDPMDDSELSEVHELSEIGGNITVETDAVVDFWTPCPEEQETSIASVSERLEVGEEGKSQSADEKKEKDNICRTNRNVSKRQQPRVPKEEQAFVPYTYYSQHSALSELEHSHYVAMSLQRASGAAFVHREDKKKFSTIKEKLTEENEKFNDEVRLITIAQHKNRYHTLPTAVRSYVQDIFLAKVQSLCRYIPRAYVRKDQFTMDPSVSAQNTPVLEVSKSLLAVGIAPAVQLPNLKRKAVIPHRDVSLLSERYPAGVHLEKVPIFADPNIPLLLEKYHADVVATTSPLRAILADFGPLYSPMYDIPVVVKHCKVNGSLKRVVYLLKPLSSTKLSIPQLLSYMAKYAVKVNLLVKPPDDEVFNRD
uniref:Uncharacterized protein n=1 Tax=Trichuris muris TaxID=70415 RepID=A0A5S6QKK7_TRIMR